MMRVRYGVLLLGLLLPGAANAQVCAATAARGGTIQVAAGGGTGFNDVDVRGAYGFNDLLVGAEYRARSFSDSDDSGRKLGIGVAWRKATGGFEVCPALGVSREELDVLTTWSVPLTLAVSRPLALGARTRFIPFVEPAFVYTDGEFSQLGHGSWDAALTTGAALGFGRVFIGAAWVKKFRDETPSSWRGFLGMRQTCCR